MAPTNIVLIVADDHRHDLLSAAGHPTVQTPNLDRLAQRGTRFTHAFNLGASHAAVCAPSRAMLHTGRTFFRIPNAIKHELGQPSFEASDPDPRRTPLLGERLRLAGYHRFGCGKWHNARHTFARSFDDADAVFFGGMADPFAVPVHGFDPAGRYREQGARVAGGHATDVFIDAAIRYVERRGARRPPWFLHCGLTAPHDPFATHERWHARYSPDSIALPSNFQPQHLFDNGELDIRDERLLSRPRDRADLRRHLCDHFAMISHLDEAVGRLLDRLQATGELERTLVVYTGDHGLALGQHGLLGKQNLYEHSVRVPLIMAGPGVPDGRTCDELVYQHDLFATLLGAAGAAPPPHTDFDLDLRRVARGEASGRRRLFFAYRHLQRAVRTREHKLIEYRVGGSHRWQLFDLVRDPDETNDLAGQPRFECRARALRAELVRAARRAGDPCVEPPGACRLTVLDGAMPRPPVMTPRAV